MTANSGDSKWITGEAARRDVHENRHRHDAILVGIETVKHDDPQLTTRLPHGGINPIRIILDTHLSIPFHAKISHRSSRSHHSLFVEIMRANQLKNN